MNKTIKKAFKNTVPVMAGYIVLGIAFGILLQTKGYNFVWSFLISLTVYAGSMQFVTVDLLSSGATFISTAIITLMVNARHLFYGISMLDKYKGTGTKKPYLIFSLTDETYALVCNGAPKDVDEKRYYLCVSLINQFYWVLGSVLGSIIGSAIAFNTAGIDFSMTALFVVILTEQLMSKDNYTSGIIGISSSIVCLLVFGSQNFLIPSMLVISLLLLIYGIISKRGIANE